MQREWLSGGWQQAGTQHNRFHEEASPKKLLHKLGHFTEKSATWLALYAKQT
jgi:hypothetical protein